MRLDVISIRIFLRRGIAAKLPSVHENTISEKKKKVPFSFSRVIALQGKPDSIFFSEIWTMEPGQWCKVFAKEERCSDVKFSNKKRRPFQGKFLIGRRLIHLHLSAFGRP